MILKILLQLQINQKNIVHVKMAQVLQTLQALQVRLHLPAHLYLRAHLQVVDVEGVGVAYLMIYMVKIQTLQIVYHQAR